MKYLLGILLISLLTIPFDVVFRQAKAAMVYNTISDSQVYQYIVIGCADDSCQSWLKNLLENVDEQPVETPELIEDPEASEDDSIEENNLAEETEVVEENNSTEESEPLEEDNLIEENSSTEQANVVEDQLDTFQPIIGPKQIRINEIMAAPISGDPEWVELYNTTAEAIDLSGWNLIEGAGKKTQLTGSIGPLGYLVFDKSSLNNGGDCVILQDSYGSQIDKVSYGEWEDSNVPAGESGNSIGLFDDEYKETEVATPSQINFFQLTEEPFDHSASSSWPRGKLKAKQVEEVEPSFVETAEDTQVEKVEEVESSFVETTEDKQVEEVEEVQPVYQFSDKIIINEFLADPLGSDNAEWIELYNSGETDVNLLGWSLDDAEGGSKPFKLEDQIVIKVNDYLVFNKEETGLVLNNSSDQINLLDPNGQIISSVDYQNPKEDYSNSWFEGGWLETLESTPGAENKKPAMQTAGLVVSSKKTTPFGSSSLLSQGDTMEVDSLAEVRSLPLRSKVKVKGQVVVLPEVFSKSLIYLNGIQIYFSKADWPELKVGDLVEVNGTLSESRNEKRILIKEKADLTILENQEVATPPTINSLGLNEEKEGVFVQVQGELVEKDSSRLIFADEFGEFVVYLKRGTKISSKLFDVGNQIIITGIVGQYDDEYRLMPRSEADMVNLTLQAKPVVG